jgi:phosphoribosylanthranilate isomerase
MTWVKICGITSLEDAEVAVEAGADALGFVFYETSPRNVQPEVAREIISALPEQVEKIGVFVDSPAHQWVGVVRQASLTGVQHSMRLSPSDSKGSVVGIDLAIFPRPPKLFFSFPIASFLEDPEKLDGLAQDFLHLRRDRKDKGEENEDELGMPPLPDGWFDTFFLDSSTPQQPGGTGQVFDWEKAVPVAEAMRQGGLKLVVAGGLTPANVAEAMRILKPWGVDVSSGVEAKPGKKDPEKVRAFIAAVRQADAAKTNASE